MQVGEIVLRCPKWCLTGAGERLDRRNPLRIRDKPAGVKLFGAAADKGWQPAPATFALDAAPLAF